MAEVECDVCLGDGICFECLGDGQFLTSEDEWEDCFDCDGTGRCFHCAGSGKVEDE